MSELGRFQDAFTAALAGDAQGLAPWLAAVAAPGLAVYRNTVAKGAVDALAASFPTVERLTGEAWFRAAAHAFAQASPPCEPSLLAYGAAFPDWLAAFAPARALPYLAGAARLDRLWTEAHLAADAAPLDAASFAGLGPEAFAAKTAVLHPSARLTWFDDNIPSLWLANRPPAEPPERFELVERGEGLLVVRPHAEVRSRTLDAGAFAFVAACAAGASLAAAAEAALAEPGADLPAIIAACLEDGLFVALQPTRGT